MGLDLVDTLWRIRRSDGLVSDVFAMRNFGLGSRNIGGLMRNIHFVWRNFSGTRNVRGGSRNFGVGSRNIGGRLRNIYFVLRNFTLFMALFLQIKNPTPTKVGVGLNMDIIEPQPNHF